MRTADYMALERRYNARNYRPLDVVLERGQGVWVWDVEGNRYLDFLSAYSAVNQGHAHPRIVAALVEQASKLTLTSRAFRNDQLPLLAKEVCELTGYPMMLPMNTGAEAVETAIKAARRWAYRVKGVPDGKAEIITCAGNFHGRTTTIVGFSTRAKYRDGYGPFTPGFVSVPFGDAGALEAAITLHTAAFLFEPIQGEGGIIVPPCGYLQDTREVCTRHNVLMIADEIQTGFGRTGKLFACDWERVRPDVLVVGKALSGGLYPVSAVLAAREVLDLFGPGSHGSTFGGNPLGAAVARAALRVLVDEGMAENSRVQGRYLMSRLQTIASEHVAEVRGRGLMIGVQLRPAAGDARGFVERLKDEGLLCKDTHGTTIRFAPPLVITREQVDWAMERVEKVLAMRASGASTRPVD